MPGEGIAKRKGVVVRVVVVFDPKKSCLYTTNGAFLGKKQETTALGARKHQVYPILFSDTTGQNLIDTSLGTVPYPRFQPAL